MNIIDFLFALIKRFVPIEEKKLHLLEEQGKRWYFDKISDENNDKTGEMLKKYGEHWATQTGLAVFFIYALKAVADFIASPSFVNDEEED